VTRSAQVIATSPGPGRRRLSRIVWRKDWLDRATSGMASERRPFIGHLENPWPTAAILTFHFIGGILVFLSGNRSLLQAQPKVAEA
jgi:hypothetical protein